MANLEYFSALKELHRSMSEALGETPKNFDRKDSHGFIIATRGSDVFYLMQNKYRYSLGRDSYIFSSNGTDGLTGYYERQSDAIFSVFEAIGNYRVFCDGIELNERNYRDFVPCRLKEF